MNAPTQTASGIRILEARAVGDVADGWYVLCDNWRNPYHPFVVWWMGTAGETSSGFYAATLTEALAELERRATRQ